MSGFENPTNYARIQKMYEMLVGPLAKSARANKVTPEQWAGMLRPISGLIAELTAQSDGQQEQAAAQSSPATPKQGQRVILRDVVDAADLVDLCSIISLCTNRLDAAAYELKKAEDNA
jgi:hypothetical protein